MDKFKIDIAAFYAQEAYRDKIPGAIKITSKLGVTCFIIRMTSYDIVAFRGSANLINWAKNLMALPVPAGGGYCHAGFNLAYASVKKQVLRYVRPFRPLIITGHSLGGAIAERMCMDLAGCKDVHMITFGKPNLRFKPKKALLTHLKTQVSVINGSDIVPRVPRYFYGPDPGQDVWYFPNKGQPYYERYSLARAKMYEDWSPLDTASDHNMNDYRENIRSELP